MKGRLLLALALAAVGFAGTKSYTITLFEPASIGGADFKAGSYKVDVADQKAVVHNGKLTSELPVKVESNDAKYARTSVILSRNDGKYRVEEIHLGGTTTKLVLSGSSTSAAGQ